MIRRALKRIKKFFFRDRYPFVLETGYIEELIRDNESVLFPIVPRNKFFLRRYLEMKYDPLLYFIELQKRIDKPLIIMPQMIFWNRNPERTGNLFAPITPSATGAKWFLHGLLSSMTPSFIHFFDAVNLKDEIAKNPKETSVQLAFRLREQFLERYQAEKRLVLGPVLKSRSEMMEKVLYSEAVLRGIEKISAENDISEERLKKKAYKHFREVSADFSIFYVRFFEVILDFVFRKIFSGISYDEDMVAQIRAAAAKGPVVLTPCHKSHMDYLILSYLLFKNKLTPPHIAAGVNLSFFPVGNIFRHCGAFFIRRSFKGLDLYPIVFKQYLKVLVSESYPIEFFIEGGRTRTGRLVFPKLGFLSYLIEAVDEGYNKDLVFVPVSINYERILEESSYVKELKGKNKAKENMGAVLKSGKVLSRDYGRVHISIDQSFTLKDVEAQGVAPEERANAIAERILRGINSVTTVNPVSITSSAMLMMGAKGFSRDDLYQKAKLLHGFCTEHKVKLSDNAKFKEDIGDLIDRVIKLFLYDHIIEEVKYDEKQKVEGLYILKEDSRPRISFYKNSISHYLVGISFVSIVLLYQRRRKDSIEIGALADDFNALKDIFSREFVYPFEFDNSDQFIRSMLSGYMTKSKLVVIDNDTVSINENNEKNIVFFAKSVQDLLESYYIVVSLLSKYSKKFQRKDFVTDVRKHGLSLYHTGLVSASESLSIPNYNNVLRKLTDLGYVVEREVTKRNSSLTIKNAKAIVTMKDKLEELIKVYKY